MGNQVMMIRAQLKSKQEELARQALGHPGDKTEYGYGYVCGRDVGLTLALQILDEIEREEHEREERDVPTFPG